VLARGSNAERSIAALLLMLQWIIASFCSMTVNELSATIFFLSLDGMRRVTFLLDEADHLALKLLAIHERKAMVAVVQEAIRNYLEAKDAYSLAVTRGDDPRDLS